MKKLENNKKKKKCGTPSKNFNNYEMKYVGLPFGTVTIFFLIFFDVSGMQCQLEIAA